MSAKPTHVRLRTYQVGFGDCFLLTVTYGSPPASGDTRKVRHVLIDFGTKAGRHPGPEMVDVARAIAAHTDGILDVVVVTHRHQDHLSGYGNAEAADVIQTLAPKAIVRPWTDVPEEKDGHPSPVQLTDKQKKLVKSLTAVGDLAQQIDGHLHDDASRNAKRAKALAVLGVKNADAVRLLEEWGEDARGRWLQRGDDVDLDDLLPGVKIRVLGPPSIEDAPDLRSYKDTPDDFWIGMAEDLALWAGEGEPPPDLPIAPPEANMLRRSLNTIAQPQGLGAPAWLVGKLRRVATSQVLAMAEDFDDVLNNTSLILHITVGKRTMLFAGDAQGENWAPTLDAASGRNRKLEAQPIVDQALHDLLEAVDLYKVGHHGSRNATPRRLIGIWADAGRAPAKRPLTSVVSTKSKVFHSDEGAVPKPELLERLAELGPVHNTDELPDGVWWLDLDAEATGNATFEATEPPPGHAKGGG